MKNLLSSVYRQSPREERERSCYSPNEARKLPERNPILYGMHGRKFSRGMKKSLRLLIFGVVIGISLSVTELPAVSQGNDPGSRSGESHDDARRTIKKSSNKCPHLQIKPEMTTSSRSPSPVSPTAGKGEPVQATVQLQNPIVLEAMVRKALTIKESVLGKEHPDLVDSLVRLARIQWGQGKRAEAERELRRALKIQRQAYGPKHIKVARTLSELGRMKVLAFEVEEGEAILSEALETARASSEPSPAIVKQLASDLALHYLLSGKPSLAAPLFVEILRITEAQDGENHPNTAQALEHLGDVLSTVRKHKEAEDRYCRCITILQGLSDNHQRLLAECWDGLAYTQLSKGDLTTAEELLLEAQRMKQGLLGTEHLANVNTIHNLALLRSMQGRGEEALSLYKKALMLCKQSDDSYKLTLVDSLLRLALAQWEAKDLKGAQGSLRRVLLIQERIFGDKHPKTRRTREMMKFLLETCPDGRATCKDAKLPDGLSDRPAYILEPN